MLFFFKDKVELLGHTLFQLMAFLPLSDKVKVIAQLVAPKLLHPNFNLFSVLLAIIVKFILNIARIAKPFNLSC